MGDIFDSLSAEKDRQNQPATPLAVAPGPAPTPQQDTGGDVFDKLAAGQDVRLTRPSDLEGRPGYVDPSDMGFWNSLKRNSVGLLRLPGHVIKAFSDAPQDSMERDMQKHFVGDGPVDQMLPHDRIGLQTLLGFKRLIVDPMLEQHKDAQAYAHMYDQMTPQQRAEAEKNLSAADAQHLANMHHIASVVPLLGPAAGDMVDRMYNGDVSGGLTDLLFNIVTAGAMKKLAGTVGKLGPVERNIAGEPVQTLASQGGNETAASLETAAKAGGGAKPISRFVDEQQQALKRATGNVANQATRDAIEGMNKQPEVAPRITKPTVPTDDNMMELLKQSIEQANEKAGGAPAPTPAAAVRNVIAKVDNFQDAAETLRTAAKPSLKVVDDLTDGKLSKIWDERDGLLEKSRDPQQKFGDWQATQKRLGELTKEEEGLYSQRNMQTGRFQKVITNAQRDAAVKAGRVWKQANAMEELHAAIEGAGGDGAAMAKRISAMDPDTLDKALGGNATHVAAVKQIAELMGSGAKAAQVNNVLKLVKFITQKGSFGTSAIASRGISMILTSRAAANALATGIKAGAAAPTIAQSIDKILEREQMAE